MSPARRGFFLPFACAPCVYLTVYYRIVAYSDQFEAQEKRMSFFDHLEELRKHLIRSVLAVLLLSVLAFVRRDILFDQILLAPKSPDFLTYRVMCELSRRYEWLRGMCVEQIDFTLTNIHITGQFMQHMTISLIAGIVMAFPYLVFELWRFVKPALYPTERSSMSGLVVSMAGLFLLGIAFGYFLLAPVSLLFLGGYRVSSEVANTITLQSYAGMLSTLVLASGLIFELPVLAWFLAKAGILTSDWLRKNRRLAVVVNLILAAIITPSDVGSMILMSFPLLLLYEVSVAVVARAEKGRLKANVND